MLVNTIEHHGNRLYGFMRLRSKMWTGWADGVEWIPLRLLWLLEHLRCWQKDMSDIWKQVDRWHSSSFVGNLLLVLFVFRFLEHEGEERKQRRAGKQKRYVRYSRSGRQKRLLICKSGVIGFICYVFDIWNMKERKENSGEQVNRKEASFVRYSLVGGYFGTPASSISQVRWYKTLLGVASFSWLMQHQMNAP